jgi:hypothetical protein
MWLFAVKENKPHAETQRKRIIKGEKKLNQ